METNISCEKHIRRIAESLIRIPMNMLHNGFFYSFPKEDTLRDDMFYDKCWFLIKSNPQTKNEIINSTYLADIYINMKYLGCRYSKDVELKVKQVYEISKK